MVQTMIPQAQVEEIARRVVQEQVNTLRRDLLREVQDLMQPWYERQINRVWDAINTLTETQALTGQHLARLEAVVEELAQAQARTEQRMEELAQAQARTEQWMKELAQAQARSEERITGLEAAIKELAQAQARTEQRMEELAQAQARSEERITGLEAAIKELAQAQARTEQRMEELAQAQARSEERITGLEAAIKELAQAQARSEERITGLEAAIKELAQAQARSEERMTRLEATVEKLTEAQARTEITLQQLTSAVANLRKEVGALAENVGLGLEEIAYTILPSYLEYAYGFCDVTLQRTFVGPPGQEVEINLFGKTYRDDGEEITLVGEVKNRIRESQVKDFVNHLNRARRWIDGPVFPFMFGYWIHPSAERVAAENGVELIVSYKLIQAAHRNRRRAGRASERSPKTADEEDLLPNTPG